MVLVPLPPNYRIDSDPKGLATKLTHEIFDVLMSDLVYWATYRSFGMVQQQIANAYRMPVIVKVLEDGTEELAGFARVISDGVDFAFLTDVVVLPGHQKLGLGKALMTECIHNSGGEGRWSSEHWRWGLWTKDAQELYKRFGFKESQVPRSMERYGTREQCYDSE
ncbi:hypothetical protein MNV49_005358 [Pseudohyphozyma bogoriensis]|nr:hypothetical protein MNV49_005358 [Pseudohyphozyma bogoriensis]